MSACDRCGRCCKKPITAALFAMPEDIKRWEKQGRNDILQYIDPFDMLNSNWCSCDIWVNPENGEDFIDCPFLQKNDDQDIYTCLIHDTKPYNCRIYDCKNKDWREGKT